MITKRRPLGLLSVFTISSLILSTVTPLKGAYADEPVRILVRPKSGLSDKEFKKIVGAHGGKSVQRLDQIGVHIVELPASANAHVVAETLSKHPHIKFAEVDQKVAPAMAVNDPSVGSEWHIPKIGAPTAWDISQGSGVTIAILDSGVYGAHPDLASNIVAGWNVYNNTSDTSDICGHGTAVAGTAAAAGNNGIGVAGVSFSSKIMPIRIAYLDSTGSCYAYFSTMASGINYAADHGARVANLSYSGAAGSSTVQSAAQYMINKGGITTVAAENNNTNPGYAENASVFTISATDQNDAKASFSSYGSYVDLSAPGNYILTTDRSGGYSTWSGTSFSAPVVGGVAALMFSANPSISPSQVMSILEATAVDLGTPGYDIYFGNGRVNAAAAVQAARNAVTVDSTAPIATIGSPTSGASVSGLVPVNVSASDNVGVTKVELYANGSLVASDNVAPYSFSWDSTKVANGSVNLVAKAYDSAGNVGTSSTVSVNVANAVAPDTTAPSVTIKNPVNGSQVSGTVSISVSASDNVGVTQLVVYVDGAQKASATSGSLSYSWNTRKVAAGSHTIMAIAKDAAGNSSSTSISVTK
jgi:subtilisin family serine protease